MLKATLDPIESIVKTYCETSQGFFSLLASSLIITIAVHDLLTACAFHGSRLSEQHPWQD